MTGKIAGGKVTSLAALKKSLEASNRSGTWLKRVPENGILVVRFLTEPDAWFEYWEIWNGSFSKPQLEGEEVPDGGRLTRRYLANAVDIDTDRVIPLAMPIDLASRVNARMEKYGTVMDRDYELSRRGKGLDTTYDVSVEAPARRAVAKYTLLDLAEVLMAAALENEDNGEVQKFIDSKPQKAKRTAKPPRPELESDDIEEDDADALDADLDLDDDLDGLEDTEDADDEDLEDDEDEAFVFTKEMLQPKAVGELRMLAKAAGIQTSGLNKSGLIAALLG